jgi:hypothetical protein
VGKIALLIALPALLGGCDQCSNDSIHQLPSPSGDLKVILFQRDCGATTGFSSQISLLPRSEKLPNDAGNIFIADQKQDGPTGFWHGPLIKMAWLNNRTLEIRYHHSARTFKKEQQLGDTLIRYVVD